MPSPQSTDLSISINGVDQTALLQRGSVSVQMRLNQRWEASFVLCDRAGSYHPAAGQTVILTEGSGRAFLGKLHDVEEARVVNHTLGAELWLRCKCVDLMSRLDQQVCSSSSTHKNKPAGEIVFFAMQNFAWAEGVTFARSGDGGFIEDGPLVEKFVFNKQIVTDALADLAKLADKVFFIDVNGVFHFEDAGASSPAPFSITATSANFTRISLQRSKGEGAGSAGSGYFNQSWTRTSWAAWEQRYNSFTGDGSTTEWTLYDPDTMAPRAAAVVLDIKINGKSVEFGGENEGRTYTWYYGEDRITQGAGEAILTADDTLEVWYHDIDQGFIFAQDLTEITARGVIEGNSGQHARIFDDSQETNFQAAADKAEAALSLSKTLVDIVTLEANGFGPAPIFPRPGMVFSTSLSYPAISGNFTVQEVQAQEIAGAGLKYSCKCVRKASSRRLSNGIDYFRELARKRGGTTVTGGGGGAGDGGPKSGPIAYRCLLKDTTAGDDIADVISVYGAVIRQASKIRRIVATLRQPITADLVVRFINVQQSSPVSDHTIGTFTLPSTTAVDTSVVFDAFDWSVLADLSTLKADIVSSDGSQDKGGIASWVIETVGRGSGDATAAGLAWQGAYYPATAYAKDDLVESGGSTYISLQAANAGHDPAASGAWWALVAQSGATGATGAGVPTGGATGQILQKTSGADYDTGWTDPPLIVHGFGATVTPTAPTFFFPASVFAGAIARWKITTTSGSAVTGTIKVWKHATVVPSASDAINTSGLSISAATDIVSTALGDFTTLAIAAGDRIAIHLASGTDPLTFELEFS